MCNRSKSSLILIFLVVLCLSFLFSINLVSTVDSKTWTIEFDEPVTISSMQNQSIGISKNVVYTIHENGDATYESTITFTNYITPIYVNTTEVKNNAIIEHATYEQKGAMIAYTSVPWEEFEYDLPLHENFRSPYTITLDKNVEYIRDKSILPTAERPIWTIHLIPHLESGTSFNITVNYNITNFIQYDEVLGLYYYSGFEGFNSSRYIKNSYIKVKTQFPYPRHPQQGSDVYIPYIALPANGTTYDQNMSVRVIQEDPLIVEFDKDLLNDTGPLIIIVFFDKYPSPRLELTEKDEINFVEGKIFTTSDVKNYYKNRVLSYTIDRDKNNHVIIGIQFGREEFERGITEYFIGCGETKRVLDREPDTIENIKSNDHRRLSYPFDRYEINDSKKIGNYIRADEEPTDLYVNYLMEIKVPDGFVLDEENSFLEIQTTGIRFPIGFLNLIQTGQFVGFLSSIEDNKIENFSSDEMPQQANLYQSPKIETLINLPLYEIKVDYYITINRDPWYIFFSFLIAILCPCVAYISEKWTSKTQWVDKKLHYGGFFIGSLISFWSIWSYLSQSDPIELFFFHKALWLMAVLFVSIYYRQNFLENLSKVTSRLKYKK